MHASNPDKVIFPDEGFTKQDLVDHYVAVGEKMLAHVAGAPLTLERFPDGIESGGFMQKNASAHFPETIERVEIPKQDGTTTYSVVHRAEDLAYLANQGTVTFHVWTSRQPELDRPAQLVIDLDPEEGDVAGARAAARAVRDLLTDLDLACTPVATGSSGYHVVAPLEPTVTFDELGPMSQGLALVASRELPDLLTDEFRIANREGRVFVDWLRNRPAQTVVAPWSLRPRPGAPVAVPIEWADLDRTAPDGWHLNDVHEKLASGDPLASLSRSPADPRPAVATVARWLEERDLELPAFDRFRS